MIEIQRNHIALLMTMIAVLSGGTTHTRNIFCTKGEEGKFILHMKVDRANLTATDTVYMKLKYRRDRFDNCTVTGNHTVVCLCDEYFANDEVMLYRSEISSTKGVNGSQGANNGRGVTGGGAVTEDLGVNDSRVISGESRKGHEVISTYDNLDREFKFFDCYSNHDIKGLQLVLNPTTANSNETATSATNMTMRWTYNSWDGNFWKKSNVFIDNEQRSWTECDCECACQKMQCTMGDDNDDDDQADSCVFEFYDLPPCTEYRVCVKTEYLYNNATVTSCTMLNTACVNSTNSSSNNRTKIYVIVGVSIFVVACVAVFAYYQVFQRKCEKKSKGTRMILRKEEEKDRLMVEVEGGRNQMDQTEKNEHRIRHSYEKRDRHLKKENPILPPPRSNELKSHGEGEQRYTKIVFI